MGTSIQARAGLFAAVAVTACYIGVSSAAATEVIRTVSLGAFPGGVSSDGADVWVTSGRAVDEIEVSTGAVVRTIPNISGGPISSDGTHVWVITPENTVTEIDAASGAVVRTIPVERGPLEISSDGTDVWVTTSEWTVDEIEVASGTVIRTIHVDRDPIGVSSDGTDVWVASRGEAEIGMVTEIRASTGAVVRTIHVGYEPDSLSSDGTDVWVANAGEATVSEIEAASGRVIRTISVGLEPVAVSSDGTHVWVVNGREFYESLSEIEASSGTVIDTIPDVYGDPAGVSSDGLHVWMVNIRAKSVSEVEASNYTASPPIAWIESPASGGAYVQYATVPTEFWCREGKNGPGLQSCTDSNGGLGSFGTLETSSLGSSVYTVTAKSTDGQTAVASIDYRVGVPGPPTAWIESPASGGTYPRGAVVSTKFSCLESEFGPGLQSCTDSNGVSGSAGDLETTALGPNTYTATAKSTDGQSSTASISYTVVNALCTTDSGSVTLTPGLTRTPTAQTLKVKGTLTGCSGESFAAASYTATLKTAGVVSCSVLTGAGESATGAAKFKWTPNAKPSTGTLGLPLTETQDVALSGGPSSGTYAPLSLSGTLSEKFTGGSTCGVPVGTKPAKAVKKGTFTGSAVAFE